MYKRPKNKSPEERLDPEVHTGQFMVVIYYQKRAAVTYYKGKKLRMYGANTANYPNSAENVGKPRIHVYGPYDDYKVARRLERKFKKEMNERAKYEPHSEFHVRVRPVIRADLPED